MTDVGAYYQPLYSNNYASSFDEREISTRMRLLSARNPYMANDPMALQTMAYSGLDTPTLMATSGQHYAMIVGDQLASQLQRMSPATQRAVVAQLTPQQQASLQQMGYNAPGNSDDSFGLDDVIAPVGTALSFVGKGLGAIPGVSEVGGAALEALTWVGNWPGHLYRTTRLLDDEAQWAGLAGAIAGIAAVALAIPTGGSSLAALGALGLGATAGMTAASGITQSLLTNPNDWVRAFNASWDGEETFDRAAQEKANRLLLDGRMRGVASDLANADIDIVELSREMAGQRDVSTNSQIRKIEALAAQMAPVGTPDHQAAVNAMLNAFSDPLFQEAVQTLVDGKMSPGRDLADTLGIENNSGLYDVLSGGVDAVFTVAVDPTLLVGKANQFIKARAYTMNVFHGAEAATEFMRVAMKAGVLRYHTAVADAVARAERGGLALMRSINPTFERNYVDLVNHARRLVDTGQLASLADFNVDHLHQYYSEWTNLEPMLRGIGTVANSRGVQLMSMGRTQEILRDFRKQARALTSGMSDSRIEKWVRKEAGREGNEIIREALPHEFEGAVTAAGLIDKPWRYNSVAPGAYEVGRALGNIPIVGKLGDVITAITTMAPAGKAVALLGEHAARDVRALSELGRYMGMPSWARQAWADAILSSSSVAARAQALDGFIINMMKLSGLDSTDEGLRILETYSERSRQLYSMSEDLIINQHKINAGLFMNEMADLAVMPSFEEIRRAAKTTRLAKLFGVLDVPVMQAQVNKFWKPSVLLSLGFIPRAAGEEAVNFLSRGGIGSLSQEFGGRALGRARAFEEAGQLVLENKAVSKAQQQLLDMGWWSTVPAHARPLLRMAGRIGFSDVLVDKLARGYRDFVLRSIDTGFGVLDDINRKVANWAGQALDAPRVDLGYGANMGVLVRANRDGTMAAPIVNMRKLNVADYADAIFLGNEYSLRRMILGGVHNDKVEAGRLWYERHATTIMREASAITNGPVSSGYNNEDIFTTFETDSKGVLREVRQHNIPGERKYIGDGGGSGDTMYDYSVHDAAQRLLTDPLVMRTLPVLSRVKGADIIVTEANLDEALTPLLRYALDDEELLPAVDAAHRVALEFFGDFNRDSFDATVARLGRSRHNDVAQALEAHLPSAVPVSLDETIAALDDAADDLRKALNGRKATFREEQTLDTLHAVREELANTVKPVVAWLDTLNASNREFAAQFLHTQVLNGKKSWWVQHQQVRQDQLLAWEQRKANVDLLNEEAAARFEAEQQAAALRAATPVDPADAVGDQALIDDNEPPVSDWWKYSDPSAWQDAPATLPPLVLIEDVPADRWLYADLDEARNDILTELRAAIMDPNMHDAGVAKALRGVQLDAQGQYVDTALRDETVLLYEAPRLSGLSYEDLLEQSSQQRLLTENEQVVRALLVTNPDTPLIANFELAQELYNIRTSLAQAGKQGSLTISTVPRPRSMRISRRVTDGRIHRQDGNLPMDGGVIDAEETDAILYPALGVEQGAGDMQLWRMSRPAADAKLQPTPDFAVDPVAEWAQRAYKRMNDVIGRKRRYELQPKQRVIDTLPDGTQVKGSSVYMYDDAGLLQPYDGVVTPNMHDRLFDVHGRPVTFGSTDHFEPSIEPSSMYAPDVMWELTGPMMRDAADSVTGNIRFRRKYETRKVGRRKVEPVQSADLVPVFRSRVTDVRRIPQEDRPSFAIAQMMQHKKVGTWEKMVSFGFDRVIGPSIDAIVRKPMAFHQFSVRYAANKKALRWSLDPTLMNKLADVQDAYHVRLSESLDDFEYTVPEFAEKMRTIAAYDTNDVRALEWTNNETLAWLGSFDSNDELEQVLTRVLTRGKRATGPNELQAYVNAKQLSQYDIGQLRKLSAWRDDPEAWITQLRTHLPDGALDSVESVMSPSVQDFIRNNYPQYKVIDRDGWETIIAARKNIDHVSETAAESAALAAIADVVPFLDSHEFRTQFADYGKGFLPFWYAEENFMKRWARTLASEGPAVIRKAQLTYMGMKHAGVIRTDQSGKDWFVYPGSGLLNDAVQKLFPGVDINVMFQSPTDQMLPGLTNQFGVPSFSPLVTLPTEMITTLFPELQPIERGMMGDFASQRSIVDQIIPARLRNLINATVGDDDANGRYGSAQMAAIAHLEARGDGLPDDATPEQVDTFMDRVASHARIIVVAQALAGLATPGSPSTVESGSTSWSGLGVDDPADILNDQYLSLVRMLGVEAGTARFLEINQDATLDDIVQPLAYTVGRNESVSGAPLPSTETALGFIEQNAGYMSEFPTAAPWLLPQAEQGDSRSSYAYDQQTIMGLRKRRAPDEFLRAIKYKLAAQEYFPIEQHFIDKIAEAELAGNVAAARALGYERDRQLALYRAAHPIFRDELQSNKAKARREQILMEMQSIINDPLAPGGAQLDGIRAAMQTFNTYQAHMAALVNDRSNVGRRELANLKQEYVMEMERVTARHPGVMSFWTSVLRPESNL